MAAEHPGLAALACVVTLSLASSSPAQAARAVVVEATRIDVNEQIFFAEGTAVVRPRSAGLLDELARALRDNPRFTRVVIEGHTDSSGDAERNLLLSQSRANAVKAALVDRGIAAARLEAVGHGASRPIADNDAAAGRARNRRVAIVVAEVDGKRVVAPRTPLAKVSRAENRVDARAPDADDWVRAGVGHGLVRLHRVQSRERSSADITFRDASEMMLREQTLVIIFGAAAERARRRTGRARLLGGALRSRLSELAGGLVVETESAEAELAAGTALVSVDEKKTSRVANHAGRPAKLFGRAGDKRGKRAVSVQAGFGSKVTEGQDPTPPRPLPPTPGWLPGARASVGLDAAGAVVRGAWTPVGAAARYRVELARDPDGRGVVFATEVPATITRFEARQVPAGVWFARVSSIDADAFESAPSPAARFEVTTLAWKSARVPLVPTSATDVEPPSVRAGDVLTAAPGASCTLDGGEPGTLLVVPAASEVVVRCGDAPPLALGVRALDVDAAVSEGFLGGPARVRLQLPVDAPPLRARLPQGGRVLRADRANGFLSVLLHTETSATPELELLSRGVVVGRVPLPLRADRAPPTLRVVDDEVSDGTRRLRVDATDDVSGVGFVRLYQRPAGGGAWETSEMSRGDDGWSGALPASAEYFVEAVDKAGNGPARAGDVARPPAAGGAFAPWGVAAAVAGSAALVGVVAFGLDAANAAERRAAIAPALEGDLPSGAAAALREADQRLEAAIFADVVAASVLGGVAVLAGSAAVALFLLEE